MRMHEQENAGEAQKPNVNAKRAISGARLNGVCGFITRLGAFILILPRKRRRTDCRRANRLKGLQ